MNTQVFSVVNISPHDVDIVGGLPVVRGKDKWLSLHPTYRDKHSYQAIQTNMNSLSNACNSWFMSITCQEVAEEMHLIKAIRGLINYCFSLPKSTALIDREEGQDFTSLFMALRLHGITDSK